MLSIPYWQMLLSQHNNSPIFLLPGKSWRSWALQTVSMWWWHARSGTTWSRDTRSVYANAEIALTRNTSFSLLEVALVYVAFILRLFFFIRIIVHFCSDCSDVVVSCPSCRMRRWLVGSALGPSWKTWDKSWSISGDPMSTNLSPEPPQSSYVSFW